MCRACSRAALDTDAGGLRGGQADIEWACDACQDYLEAGYLAGCDAGKFVSDICGPYKSECAAAFKILCDACKVETCDTACEHKYACSRLHLCPAPGPCTADAATTVDAADDAHHHKNTKCVKLEKEICPQCVGSVGPYAGMCWSTCLSRNPSGREALQNAGCGV